MSAQNETPETPNSPEIFKFSIDAISNDGDSCECDVIAEISCSSQMIEGTLNEVFDRNPEMENMFMTYFMRRAIIRAGLQDNN